MLETERLISNLSNSLQEYEDKIQGFESEEDASKNRNYTNRKSWITVTKLSDRLIISQILKLLSIVSMMLSWV